jgi:hypothetical protein
MLDEFDLSSELEEDDDLDFTVFVNSKFIFSIVKLGYFLLLHLLKG